MIWKGANALARAISQSRLLTGQLAILHSLLDHLRLLGNDRLNQGFFRYAFSSAISA